MKSFFQKLLGRQRILFGLCPECNSDAPALYECKVCRYSTEFPPSAETKRKQWKRFLMARCTHGYPMEDRCPECSEWLHEHLNKPTGNPRKG